MMPCPKQRRGLCLAALMSLAAILSACAGLPAANNSAAIGPSEYTRCVSTFSGVDAAIDEHAVRDAQDARIEGFPYLRVNRLLAHIKPGGQGPLFDAWLDRLALLDEEARAFEVANLPAAAREMLDSIAHRRHGRALVDALGRCRELLVARDRADAKRGHALIMRAHVPDDYSYVRRVLGLYPVLAPFFRAGIERLETRLRSRFDREDHGASGRWRRYVPPAADVASPAEVAAILARSTRAPLELPEPAKDDLERLFATFAPAFLVDEQAGYDRIGALRYDDAGSVVVDPHEPVVYRRAGWTLMGDRALLQLVYTIWFPHRPAESRFDLLAGHLDGLIWRVTLAPEGRALIYDSIHPCGCYHQFFPTEGVESRPPPSPLIEWAFVPQRLAAGGESGRVAIRIASATHYIERVEADAPDGSAAVYRFAPESALRSLPAPGGTRRSAYDPGGFIAGTERLERWLFWPMGIVNPGAMRQWGRHATAFVGERHFDDPQLFDRRFRRRD